MVKQMDSLKVLVQQQQTLNDSLLSNNKVLKRINEAYEVELLNHGIKASYSISNDTLPSIIIIEDDKELNEEAPK